MARTGEEATILRPAAALAAFKLLLIGVVTVAAMALAPAAAPGDAGSTSLTAQIMRRGSVTVPDTANAETLGAVGSSNGRFVEQVERVERDGEIVTLITVVIDL